MRTAQLVLIASIALSWVAVKLEAEELKYKGGEILRAPEGATHTVRDQKTGYSTTYQLGESFLDNIGRIITVVRSGSTLDSGALFSWPITPERMRQYQEESRVNRNLCSQTTLWIEPVEGDSLIIYGSISDVPHKALTELGFNRDNAPILRLHMVSEQKGPDFTVAVLVCEGAKVYGATQGPIMVDGKPVRKLKGWVIKNARPVPPKR